MSAIAGAAANPKNKKPAAGIANLDEDGNHTLDRSNVDCVDNFPRFLKVTLRKGHNIPRPWETQRSHRSHQSSSPKPCAQSLLGLPVRDRQPSMWYQKR